MPDFPITAELGLVNQQRLGGTLYDDFLPQLRGRRAANVYREMSWNDSVIGSILFAVEMVIRQVKWTAEGDDELAVEFLQENIAGLEHSWEEFVANLFTALPYGFSFHETVYQIEEGRVRWRKFGYRPQDSLLRWELDDKNEPVAFIQQTPGAPVPIPLAKGIYFRLDSTRPEGRSVLRTAYRDWFMRKRATEHLMIGLERNLSGLPMAEVPPEIVVQGEGSEPYDTIKKIVTRTKRDEQMGVIWPLFFDEHGNQASKFSLLSPEGNPRFDQVVSVIRMFSMDMASTVAAQFIGLGRDAVGSRALAEPQQEFFQTALEAWLDQAQDVLNRQAVKPLFEMNAFTETPRLVHSPAKDVDIKAIAETLLAAAQGGAEIFTGMDEDPVRDRLLEMLGFDTEARVGVQMDE